MTSPTTPILLLAELNSKNLLDVAWIDYLVLLVYFAFVIGIGYVLKKQIHGTKDFFE